MNYGVEISMYEGQTIGYFGGKFLPLHQGHVQMILKASQLVDVLFVVVGYDDVYDQHICAGTKFEWVSSRQRERWVTKTFREYPNIRVLSQYERRSEQHMTDEAVWQSNQELLQKVGGKIDICFSSEPSYEAYFKKMQPTSQHIVLDAERTEVTISATEIRNEGVYNYWDYLPKAVQETYIKRVCLCGIESVGKSHLVKMLATTFNTNYVEEYGRTYYDAINGWQDIDFPGDYAEIAIGHAHLINEAIERADRVLFIDTDATYTHFFYKKAYNQTNAVVASLVQQQLNKIDAYIFIEPFNEYELDGTRRPVDEKTRHQHNEQLKAFYQDYGIKLFVVNEPTRINRYEKCVEIVKNLLV